jgi:hypothetical protein
MRATVISSQLPPDRWHECELAASMRQWVSVSLAAAEVASS